MSMSEAEEFRCIDSLFDAFEVNGDGTVLRYAESKSQVPQRIDSEGRNFVWISTADGVVRRYIDELVAECWLGERPEMHTVAHANGKKRDNRYENLHYVPSHCKFVHQHIIIREERTGAEHKFASTLAGGRWLVENTHASENHIRYLLGKKRTDIEGFRIIYA